MDLLGQVTFQLGTLVLATWALAQALSSAHPRINGLWVAIVVGPLMAVLAQRYGYFPLAASIAADAHAPVIGTAAFGGLIATICAKLGNDYIFNPLRNLVQKVKP